MEFNRAVLNLGKITKNNITVFFIIIRPKYMQGMNSTVMRDKQNRKKKKKERKKKEKRKKKKTKKNQN